MKNAAYKLILLFIIIGAMMIANVSAQSRSVGRADIPFSFVIGNQEFASGEYEITYITEGMFRIYCHKSGVNVMAQARPSISSAMAEGSNLIFRRYGARYVLSQIWQAGDNVGYALNKARLESSLEKESARILPRNEVARHAPELYTVPISTR